MSTPRKSSALLLTVCLYHLAVGNSNVLKNVTSTGDFYYPICVGTLALDQSAKVPIVIYPRTIQALSGEHLTRWMLPTLTTLLVPSDRDHLRWINLAGQRISFKITLVGRNYSAAGGLSPWSIRSVDPRKYVISAPFGPTFEYSNGELIWERLSSGTMLKYEMQGPQVTKISRLQGNAAADILSCSLDLSGRLTAINFGGATVAFSYDLSDNLIAIVQDGHTIYSFGYTRHLLTSLRNGKEALNLTWMLYSIPYFARNFGLSSIYLRTDGLFEYQLSTQPSGAIIQAFDSHRHLLGTLTHSINSN